MCVSSVCAPRPSLPRGFRVCNTLLHYGYIERTIAIDPVLVLRRLTRVFCCSHCMMHACHIFIGVCIMAFGNIMVRPTCRYRHCRFELHCLMHVARGIVQHTIAFQISVLYSSSNPAGHGGMWQERVWGLIASGMRQVGSGQLRQHELHSGH